MNTLRTSRTRAGMAGILALFACGCGGMQQPRLAEQLSPARTPGAPAESMPVVVGTVTAHVEQPADLQDAVCRYLRDQTAAAIARHDAFVLVQTNAPTDLLSGFGVVTASATESAVSPVAAFDVEVLRIEEKLGATVKVGLASKQQKQAVCEVKIIMRSLTGDRNLESRQIGKAAKGAWGIIAAVDRDAMKGGAGAWDMDGSMIGLACADAVQAGIKSIEKQIRLRSIKHGQGVEQRLLKPRTVIPNK